MGITPCSRVSNGKHCGMITAIGSAQRSREMFVGFEDGSIQIFDMHSNKSVDAAPVVTVCFFYLFSLIAGFAVSIRQFQLQFYQFLNHQNTNVLRWDPRTLS